MAKDKPRLTRLTSILTQLQSKRLLTANQIAEKHDISLRTVYRDIRTLLESGIPIITIEGKGYSIMEGFQLPPVMFTQEEANAMIIAEHLILKNKDQSLIEHYQNAVTKIKTTLKYSQKTATEFLADRIEVRNNPSSQTTSNYLIELQSTIANFKVVTIQYLSLSGDKTKRDIEPFAIYTTQGNWLLLAFCRTRKEFRAFRLDCIEHIHVSDKSFTPHDITLEEYLKICKENGRRPLTYLRHRTVLVLRQLIKIVK